MLSEALPGVPQLLTDKRRTSHVFVPLLVCREALVIGDLANLVGFVRAFRVQHNESPPVVPECQSKEPRQSGLRAA